MDKNMKWVKCEDQLPPIDEWILFTQLMVDACVKGDYYTDVNIGLWDGKSRNAGGSLAVSCGGWGDDSDWSPCSHWMLPPEVPPIEDNEK